MKHEPFWCNRWREENGPLLDHETPQSKKKNKIIIIMMNEEEEDRGRNKAVETKFHHRRCVCLCTKLTSRMYISVRSCACADSRVRFGFGCVVSCTSCDDLAEVFLCRNARVMRESVRQTHEIKRRCACWQERDAQNQKIETEKLTLADAPLDVQRTPSAVRAFADSMTMSDSRRNYFKDELHFN